MAQNLNVAGSQEDYIPQISEEIEGNVTKKLSQEFSRTENRNLGALARLAGFLIKPFIQGHSRTAPESFRNAFGKNQRTNDTTPRVMLIRKQASSSGRLRKIRAQKLATTVA